MNRIAALAVSLIALNAACGSQPLAASSTATLEGTVLGASSALTVGVPGTASSTTTDPKGHFALLAVPAGASALHFGGAGVDATLSIAALSKSEHRNIRVEVSGHDAKEHPEESDATLRGPIASIAAPSFLIGTRRVTVTTATTFEKSGIAITFADLTLGDEVEAEGALQADGTLLARSVKVEDAKAPEADGGTPEPQAHGVEFTGTLTAVSGSTLTVGTSTVTVDAATHIEKADQTIAASALTQGDLLKVEGALQTDGSVLASEIKVLSAAEQAQVTVEGKVSALSPADGTFSVGTTVLHTDAQTTFGGQGKISSLADLALGDEVEVEAAQQTDGSLLALSVHRVGEPEEGGEVEVKGAIEALTATSLQVQGKSFVVDASTAIKSAGSTVAFSTLSAGQIAEVRGAAAADGSLHATRISLESGH